MSRTVALWALALSVLSLFSLSNAVTVGSVEINSYQGAYQHLLDSIRSNNTGMIQISAAAMSTLMMEGGGSEEQLLTILSEPQLQKMHETLVLNMIDKNPNLVTQNIVSRLVLTTKHELFRLLARKGSSDILRGLWQSDSIDPEETTMILLEFIKNGRYSLVLPAYKDACKDLVLSTGGELLKTGAGTYFFHVIGDISHEYLATLVLPPGYREMCLAGITLIHVGHLAHSIWHTVMECKEKAHCIMGDVKKQEHSLSIAIYNLAINGQTSQLELVLKSLEGTFMSGALGIIKETVTRLAIHYNHFNILEFLNPGSKNLLIERVKSSNIDRVTYLLQTSNYSNSALFEAMLQPEIPFPILNTISSHFNHTVALSEATRGSSKMLQRLLDQLEFVTDFDTISTLMLEAVYFGDSDATYILMEHYVRELPEESLESLVDTLYPLIPKAEFVKILLHLNSNVVTQKALNLAIQEDDSLIMEALMNSNLIDSIQFLDVLNIADAGRKDYVMSMILVSQSMSGRDLNRMFLEAARRNMIQFTKVLLPDRKITIASLASAYQLAHSNTALQNVLWPKVKEIFFKIVSDAKTENEFSVFRSLASILHRTVLEDAYSVANNAYRNRYRDQILEVLAARLH